MPQSLNAGHVTIAAWFPCMNWAETSAKFGGMNADDYESN